MSGPKGMRSWGNAAREIDPQIPANLDLPCIACGAANRLACRAARSRLAGGGEPATIRCFRPLWLGLVFVLLFIPFFSFASAVLIRPDLLWNTDPDAAAYFSRHAISRWAGAALFSGMAIVLGSLLVIDRVFFWQAFTRRRWVRWLRVDRRGVEIEYNDGHLDHRPWSDALPSRSSHVLRFCGDRPKTIAYCFGLMQHEYSLDLLNGARGLPSVVSRRAKKRQSRRAFLLVLGLLVMLAVMIGPEAIRRAPDRHPVVAIALMLGRAWLPLVLMFNGLLRARLVWLLPRDYRLRRCLRHC